VRRTARQIEEQKANAQSTRPSRKTSGIGRGNHPNSRKQLKPQPWPKGVSGNPSGLPGTDLAAVAARRFFEKHPQGITASMKKDLQGLNAYGFSVLADRGYGKLKEKVELTGLDVLADKLSQIRKRKNVPDSR